MSRVCTVCAHPERAAIDRALAGGESVSALAARYCTNGRVLGRMALERHRATHLSVRLVKAAEREDMTQALDVVRQLKAINSASLAVLKDARDAGAPSIALAAIDRIHRQIELQAKLLGDLSDAPTVNVLVSPEWLSVRSTLLAALQPFPDARVAVAARLRALEGA